MDDILVNFGGELKSLGVADDGAMKFGAWLVLYGDADNHDASSLRDYFTKSTDFDFEDGDKTTVYWNHGLDPELKRRKLGTATLHKKDAGVWMEGVLKARDEYEAKIQEMIRAGKLGASSGVPSHLVERKAVGSAHEILLWPLGKDASLTPTPAEWRTSSHELKSLAEVEALSLKALVEFGDELKATASRGWQTQPRDDLGRWTDGAGNLSAAHVAHVMRSEGIHESRHAEVLDKIKDGTHKTRADVLAHIDSIHATGKAGEAAGVTHVVYHGTGNDFDAFDHNRAYPSHSGALFFTPDKEDAARYASIQSRGGKQGRLITADVTLKKDGWQRFQSPELQRLPVKEAHLRLQSEGYDGYKEPGGMVVAFPGADIQIRSKHHIDENGNASTFTTTAGSAGDKPAPLPSNHAENLRTYTQAKPNIKDNIEAEAQQIAAGKENSGQFGAAADALAHEYRGFAYQPAKSSPRIKPSDPAWKVGTDGDAGWIVHPTGAAAMLGDAPKGAKTEVGAWGAAKIDKIIPKNWQSLPVIKPDVAFRLSGRSFTGVTASHIVNIGEYSFDKTLIDHVTARFPDAEFRGGGRSAMGNPQPIVAVSGGKPVAAVMPLATRLEPLSKNGAQKSLDIDGFIPDFDDEYKTESLDVLTAGQREGSRFIEHTTRLHDAVAEYHTRFESFGALKAGRTISKANHDCLSELHKALGAFLEEHAPKDEADEAAESFAGEGREGKSLSERAKDDAKGAALQFAAQAALADYAQIKMRISRAAVSK